MIRWPERLQYGGVSFPILFVDANHISDDRYGECGVMDGHLQVRVSDAMTGDFRDMVVCHEIVHAWLRLSGMNVEDEATEELLCDTFGQGLLQVLRTMLEKGGVLADED